MKQINQFFLLSGLFFVLNACSDIILEPTSVVPPIEESEGVVYPLSDSNTSSTRSSDLETNWENMKMVSLPQAKDVNTPWAHTLGGESNHNIPLDIAEDIKSSDGWELIAHTMKPNSARNSNYLIFHNYITGILKVFYYVDGKVTPNNTGFWKLEILGNQRMLNFADEIADPLSHGGSRKTMIVSNLIKDNHKGFTMGWNCFQVELAYDPNFSTGTMSISAYNCNTMAMNMGGIYEESATGSIVSQSSQSSNSSGNKSLGSLLGKAADAWLKKQVDNGSIKSNSQTRAISSSIIGAAVKAVSSFVGKKKENTNEYQTIQLKTEGKINLTGTIMYEAASIIMPLNFSCSVSNVGPLGGWNLRTSPTFRTSPYAQHYKDLYGADQEYVSRGFTWLQTDIIRNPKAVSKITNQSVEYHQIIYSSRDYLPTLSNEYNNFAGGSLQKGYNGGTMYMKEAYNKTLDGTKTILYNANGQLKVTCFRYDVLDSYGNVLPQIDLRTTPIRGGTFGYARYGDKSAYVRVNVKCDATINGVKTSFMNTKTFYPRYEW